MRYEFTVAARLSQTALAAFPELHVSATPGKGTTLYGPIIDRAHLEGLLVRFGNLGLEIVDMHRLPD
jgi:hypothetical protein